MITETTLQNFQVLDLVALNKTMLQENLKAGTIGTIVDIWNKEKQVFEIEFCDQYGETVKICAIESHFLINISMEKEVAKLPFFHQIAFAYRISQRLFPNYVKFVETEHFGNIETLEKGLNILKEIVLKQEIHEEIEEKIKKLLPEIEEIAPDTEDYGSLEATLSLDSCSVVYEALLGILGRDSAKISSVAFFPFNTAETITYAEDLNHFDLLLAEKEFQEKLLILAKSTERAEDMF